MPPFAVNIPDGFGVIDHFFTFGAFDAEGAHSFLGFKLLLTDVTVADVDEAQDEYNQAFNGATPLHGSEVTIGPFTIRYRKAGAEFVVEGTASDVSGSGDSAATINTALLLRKVTALGGRKNRGRMYIPGPKETALDAGGFLVGTYLPDQEAAVASYLSGLRATLWFDEPYLFHSYDTAAPPVPLPAPTEITALHFQNRAATQRRRMRP